MFLSLDDTRVLWRTNYQIMGSILAYDLKKEAEWVSETPVRKKTVTMENAENISQKERYRM